MKRKKIKIGSKKPHWLFRYSLKTNLVIFVFFVFCLTNLLVSLLYAFFSSFPILPIRLYSISLPNIALLFLLSLFLGTILTTLAGQQVFMPIQQLIEGTKEIAAGNFDVYVEVNTRNEIGRLTENFNYMAKELSSIETLRADFINNISHEFKTPVASIKGFAKLLKKDTLTEESRQEYLDIIISESQRLSKLAGNVLLLSNLDQQTAGSGADAEEFSLDEQVRRTILLLEPQISKKKLNVGVELEPALITGNYDLLSQIWINLISNAVKFTPEGGGLYISMVKKNGLVSVSIKDTGVGIEEEVQRYIFDKFYQSDQSRTTEGNGLGLSIVKGIAELNGGSVKVRSRLGEGSEFIVELPV